MKHEPELNYVIIQEGFRELVHHYKTKYLPTIRQGENKSWFGANYLVSSIYERIAEEHRGKIAYKGLRHAADYLHQEDKKLSSLLQEFTAKVLDTQLLLISQESYPGLKESVHSVNDTLEKIANYLNRRVHQPELNLKHATGGI